MAIEDGYTLARCLTAAGADREAALQRYEDLRRGRTATVQKISRDNIAFFHNAGIDNLEARLNSQRDAHLWLYGFDATDQDFGSSA